MRPATMAVAGFIGTPPMNLLPAIWAGDQLTVQLTDQGGRHATAGRLQIRSPGRAKSCSGIRPGDLRLAASGLPARVELIEDLGDSLIIDLQAGGRQIKLKVTGRLQASPKASCVHLRFDSGSTFICSTAPTAADFNPLKFRTRLIDQGLCDEPRNPT